MRKGLTISAIGHLAVVGFGLVAFTGKPFEHVPQESLPVDIISSEQLSQMTKGTKDAKKDAPKKPLVEKVAPEKPIEETKAQVSDKKEITASAPAEVPPVPKGTKIEDKPEPVKDKPKEEPKKVDAPDDKSKVDPIAEQIKKEKAEKEKKKAETPPPPKPKPKQEEKQKFDADRIAALLDKRAPRRNAATGETINASASLGTQTGRAQSLTPSWASALQARIAQCWNVPAGARDAEQIKVRIFFELNRDGTVRGQPQLVEVIGVGNQFAPAIADAAVRAIPQCQPYDFLPQSEYAAANGWEKLDIVFSPMDMFRQ